jgi:hypothetical protein
VVLKGSERMSLLAVSLPSAVDLIEGRDNTAIANGICWWGGGGGVGADRFLVALS